LVDDFNARFEIPQRLSGLGVENPDIDRLVAGALADPSCGGNPVELTADNIRALLAQVV